MFEVKNRSKESWGILADCDDKMFDAMINYRKEPAKAHIKVFEKRKKKLKTYKVSFKKEWHSDQFELQAENDWDIGYVAEQYFKQNEDKIGFKERPRDKWAGSYKGYDSISYVKVRS